MQTKRKVKAKAKANDKVRGKVKAKAKSKVEAKAKVTAKIKVKPRSRGSHQKDLYLASRTFGATLADELYDTRKTVCFIATVPTQDTGLHYSASWSFGITLAG